MAYFEILLMALLALGLFFIVKKQTPFFAIAVATFLIPVGLLAVGVLVMKISNGWFYASYPLMMTMVLFSLQFTHKYMFEDKQKRIITKALRGYTSKAVVRALAKKGEEFLNNYGDRKELTVLMFDIKNFTWLTSKLDKAQVFTLLNRIFEITDGIIIDKYHGVIDKKMGDAAMALFGLDDDPDHAYRAICAAMDIQEAMFEHFGELSKILHKGILDESVIHLRVGLSTGEMLVGNVGSEGHFNFTTVGSAVNRCQRLESNCRVGRVLISEETYEAVTGRVVVNEHEVPGKREEEIYKAYEVTKLLSAKPDPDDYVEHTLV